MPLLLLVGAGAPKSEAAEDLPVVLAFDGNATNALVVERPITEPTGIGDDQDVTFARSGRGHEDTRLVALALFRFLLQIVRDERKRVRGILFVQQKEVAGVVSPTQAADDRRFPRKSQFLRVRVEIGVLDS